MDVTVEKSDETVEWQAIMKTPPVTIFYPFEMQRAGITAEVLATLTIEADGKVSAVVVDRASQLEFVHTVVNGLSRCSFYPAKRAGVAVRSWAQCKVQFRLDDE